MAEQPEDNKCAPYLPMLARGEHLSIEQILNYESEKFGRCILLPVRAFDFPPLAWQVFFDLVCEANPIDTYDPYLRIHMKAGQLLTNYREIAEDHKKSINSIRRIVRFLKELDLIKTKSFGCHGTIITISAEGIANLPYRQDNIKYMDVYRRVVRKNNNRINISKGMRFDALKKSGFKCAYCGRGAEETKLHVDHIIPIANGGGNGMDNLITACADCNLGKKDKTLTDDLRSAGWSKGVSDE